MMWRDVITLITETETKNGYGDPVKMPTAYTEVFADKKAVTRAEFYQANTAGYKVDAVFKIRFCDYDSQEKLTHGTTEYTVIRTYTADDEFIELVCSRGVR